ncbi:MAG: sigma-54-dependent Fis family transcriptional regulator, partial [Bacteroidales bacterium]|nr:sigma-54-dependent Fis family transcriptional regulator [Bacteroidales bacterium]
ERGNDIILLSGHFIKEFCAENNLAGKSLTKAAADKLLKYAFPGNIRELKSVIELAVALSVDEAINGENIILGNEALMNERPDKEMTLREYNIHIVKKYLERHDNDIKLVAQKLDIGVATIYRMLKEQK